MSEKKQSEVLIEREGKTWRWGESAYLKTWTGLKQTISRAALKAALMPIALVLGIFTFYSGRKDSSDSRGKELSTPSIVQNIPIVGTNILSAISKTVGKEKSREIAVSRIKIFNLGSSVKVPLGTEARAILASGATNGIVKARLETALLVEQEPVVPEGAIVFGHGKSTEERLYVEFEKVIFPSGESFTIRAQAFDASDKILGLKGSLIGTKTKKMGMAMGFGLLGGMADALQDTTGASPWGMQQKKSIRDAAFSGASKAALDQSQAYMEEMKNSPNIIEVKQGTEFFIIIDEPKKEDAKYE